MPFSGSRSSSVLTRQEPLAPKHERTRGAPLLPPAHSQRWGGYMPGQLFQLTFPEQSWHSEQGRWKEKNYCFWLSSLLLSFIEWVKLSMKTEVYEYPYISYAGSK